MLTNITLKWQLPLQTLHIISNNLDNDGEVRSLLNTYHNMSGKMSRTPVDRKQKVNRAQSYDKKVNSIIGSIRQVNKMVLLPGCYVTVQN